MKFPSIQFQAAVAATLMLAACGRANRSDTVDLTPASISAARDYQRAATCIEHNMFPGNKVRVAADGLTFSFTRKDPSADALNEATAGDLTTVEVGLFSNRAIADNAAGNFTVLSLGDENDAAMIGVAETCVRQNMPNAMNYEILKPLPAPAGFKPLSVLVPDTRRP